MREPKKGFFKVQPLTRFSKSIPCKVVKQCYQKSFPVKFAMYEYAHLYGLRLLLGRYKFRYQRTAKIAGSKGF